MYSSHALGASRLGLTRGHYGMTGKTTPSVPGDQGPPELSRLTHPQRGPSGKPGHELCWAHQTHPRPALGKMGSPRAPYSSPREPGLPDHCQQLRVLTGWTGLHAHELPGHLRSHLPAHLEHALRKLGALQSVLLGIALCIPTQLSTQTADNTQSLRCSGKAGRSLGGHTQGAGGKPWPQWGLCSSTTRQVEAAEGLVPTASF